VSPAEQQMRSAYGRASDRAHCWESPQSPFVVHDTSTGLSTDDSFNSARVVLAWKNVRATKVARALWNRTAFPAENTSRGVFVVVF
jgi:hypothetical protein